MKVEKSLDIFAILVVLLIVIGLSIVGNISAFRFLHLPKVCEGAVTASCIIQGFPGICLSYLINPVGLPLIVISVASVAAFIVLIVRERTAEKNAKASRAVQEALKDAEI